MSGLKLTGTRHDAWAAALVAGAILALSFVLSPSPAGYGTHRKLLMPPCFMRLATSVPCPFCGMTTGFTHMARGHIQDAAQANLMAPAGFVACLIMAFLGLYGAITGRVWLPRLLGEQHFYRVLMILILALWAANLAIHFGGLHV